MWLYALALLVLALVAAIGWGRLRWRSRSARLISRIQLGAQVPPAGPVQLAETADLPEPVQRYFRHVLTEGGPRIASVEIDHSGTFDLGENEPRWRPFRSHQLVSPYPPAFDWDARISMMPGVDAFVHDAFAGGQGLLRVDAMGLLGIVDIHDTPELAEGELQRYLAEAVWHPTSLLPSAGVTWQAVDANRARATVRAGAASAMLEFQFDEKGWITRVYSPARFRMVDGVPVATPWVGRFWDYQPRHGQVVPLGAEVAWLLPEGPKPYWRGCVEKIVFNPNASAVAA